MTDLATGARSRPLTALAASVGFLALLAAGPLCWLLAPPVRTQATPPPPAFEFRAFRTGRWTEELRLHLRESSPVTATIRGLYLEARYLLGVFEPDRAVVGRGGWLFLRRSLTLPTWELPARGRFLRALAGWSEARGVSVLVVVVPDKARIYQDRLPPPGLSERKVARYDEILAQIRASGLEAFDLAAAMTAWRTRRPEELLYHRGDTHWTAAAIARTSELIAARLFAPDLRDRLGPIGTWATTPLHPNRVVPDLARLLGFRPGGPVGQRLAEEHPFTGLRVRAENGRALAYEPHQPTAAIALCGDSFAASGGLLAASGRLVDWTGVVPAGGPFRGLLDTVRRIDAGELEAGIVVWELVERSWDDRSWRDPPALPEAR